MAGLQIDDVAGVVQDVTYVSVGLAVIALQRLQVRRHELTKALGSSTGGARDALEVVGSLVHERLRLVEERVSATRDVTRR